MCHHFPAAAFIIEHHFIAPHFLLLSSLELSLITVPSSSSLSLPKSSLDLHQLPQHQHPSLFFFPSVIIFIFIFVVVVVYRSVPVLIIGPLLLLLSGFPIHPVHSLSLSLSLNLVQVSDGGSSTREKVITLPAFSSSSTFPIFFLFFLSSTLQQLPPPPPPSLPISLSSLTACQPFLCCGEAYFCGLSGLSVCVFGLLLLLLQRLHHCFVGMQMTITRMINDV